MFTYFNNDFSVETPYSTCKSYEIGINIKTWLYILELIYNSIIYKILKFKIKTIQIAKSTILYLN